MEKKLTIIEQASEAIRLVNQSFVETLPPIPEEATLLSLWMELCAKKGVIKKPLVVNSIRAILEDPRLTGLSVTLIADIVKQVFEANGAKCETSADSVRWYISQKTLEWSIKSRDKSAK